MSKYLQLTQPLSHSGSFILSTPILMYQRIEEGYWYGPRQYCMERFPSKTHERAFILYQFIAAYLLPVLTISFCYTLMVKRVGQPTVEPVDNNYQVQVQGLFCSVWCLVVIAWLQDLAASCHLIKSYKRPSFLFATVTYFVIFINLLLMSANLEMSTSTSRSFNQFF